MKRVRCTKKAPSNLAKTIPGSYNLGSIAVTSAHVSIDDIVSSGCYAIYEYWNSLRGTRFAPSWNEFDLISLPPDCITYSHVVDVSADPFNVTFRFWGTGLTDVLFFDRTGQSLITTDMGYLNEERREQVLADYKTVISDRAPMPFLWDASSTRTFSNRLIVPSIRLPLSSDGENVTHIITHFDFASQNRDVWENMFNVSSREQK